MSGNLRNKDADALRKELEASRMIHRQIAKLNAAKGTVDAVADVLRSVGEYMHAERAYIFEKEGDGSYSNTQEWCAEGVAPEIDTLQHVPAEGLAIWLNTLLGGRCVMIPDIEDIRVADPFVYETLKRQDIHSVVVAPIAVDEHLLGFIGVDNPDADMTDIIAESLTVLGAFIGTVIRNKEDSKRLLTSHTMQREIFSAISCGVLAFTMPEQQLLAINSEAKRIIGYQDGESIDEALKRFIRQRIVSEDRAAVGSCELRRPGDMCTYTYSVETPEGLVHMKSNVRMLRLPSGENYILCSLLDITEQVELTGSLENERKSYRDALGNGSEFTFFFDVTEGLIREEFVTAHGVNLVRELGFTLPVSFDELLARFVERAGIEFLRPEMAAYFTCRGLLDAFDRGVTNAVTEYYNPSSGLYVCTNCLMSRDSRTGHVHASVVATDITAVRKQELRQREALREANAKLEQLNDEMSLRLDAIVNGIAGGLKIAEATGDFPYTYVSEGAAALQGYTVTEFMEKFGHSVISNIYPGVGEIALADANAQIAKNGIYTVKYTVPHKDGSTRWVIDRGKLVTDQLTGRSYYYILMQDVTELEQRNAQLGDALSIQREMAASLGSGILAYTIPDRNILLLNNTASQMFGCRGVVGSRLEMDIMGHVSDADRESMREATSRLRESGDRVEYSFHYNHEDGSIRTYICNTALLRLSTGQQYILSSINDVTDLELMEKRIAEERFQYRNALSVGSAAFFSIDLSDGYLRENVVSREGVDMMMRLHLTLPVSYDRLIEAWFSPGRIATRSDGAALLRDREAILERCRRGSSVIDFEYSVPELGKYYRLMVLLGTINNIPHASFILYDVTADRKEEQQRRAVIETLGKIYSGLYHLSLKDDRYVAYKQNADTEQELPARGSLASLREIYAQHYVLPEFRKEVADFLLPDAIRTALRNAEYTSIEYRRTNIGWCRITLVVAGRDEGGEVTSVVFAGTVIEQQKQMELSRQEALRVAYEAANMASTAKSDFLTNMSHDIRTPMNAIIGMTAIAGTHLDDKERVADCLDKITVSSKHLLGLINEVLDMSKIESGKMELQEEEFVLPELIDNLLTMTKPSIAAKNHELQVTIHNIEHENVIGDSQRIQQVFMNIMSNAVKYTPDGGRIHLTISEKPTNRRKVGCYEFIFEDNGIGMSEEFMEHLFEPFMRAVDDERVSSIQGTGLGMPITRNIIQMMNGTTKVESKLNEGTRVTLTFFLKLRSEDDSLAYERFVDLPVLVADDDAISCECTCQMLDEMGMRSEGVHSGEEAVRRVLERHGSGSDYFAVILDWKMSEVDGVEATRQIRRLVGEAAPVIIISAYDWSEIEPAARAAGADAFISKPLFKSRVVHLFSELTGEEKSEQHAGVLDALAREDYSGRRVLLAEDNELNAEIATEILGMAGLDVTVAENGKVAVDLMSAAEDGAYDIVFMDIQMPIMNGYEASRAIRALPRNYTRSVPIIAMTANAFAEDVTSAKNAGMNEHMAKPIDFDNLLKVLKRWLG